VEYDSFLQQDTVWMHVLYVGHEDILGECVITASSVSPLLPHVVLDFKGNKRESDVDLKRRSDQVTQMLRWLLCCDAIRWGKNRKEGVAGVCSSAGCPLLGDGTRCGWCAYSM